MPFGNFEPFAEQDRRSKFDAVSTVWLVSNSFLVAELNLCFVLQVSVESLKAANGIVVGDSLDAGDVITIPK